MIGEDLSPQPPALSREGEPSKGSCPGHLERAAEEAGQALSLLFDGAPHGGWEIHEGLELHQQATAFSLVLPHAQHLAVDQEYLGDPALGTVDTAAEVAWHEVPGVPGGGDDVLVET